MDNAEMDAAGMDEPLAQIGAVAHINVARPRNKMAVPKKIRLMIAPSFITEKRTPPWRTETRHRRARHKRRGITSPRHLPAGVFKGWGAACRFRKSTLRTPSGAWN